MFENHIYLCDQRASLSRKIINPLKAGLIDYTDVNSLVRLTYNFSDQNIKSK